MRISGPKSVHSALRPAPWFAPASARAIMIVELPAARIAPTLPPQARGDAACLTLLMAQSYAAAPSAARPAYVPLEDNAPIFSVRA